MSIDGLTCHLLADVEAEDVDLGGAHIEDLALDVDGDMDQDHDPEALDSDADEDDLLNQELGIEDDETDGQFFFDHPSRSLVELCPQFQCMSCRCTLCYQVKNKCSSSSRLQRARDLL